MAIITIDSDTEVDIDTSFKVSAGPGAGKTHWLSSHIRHVIKESKRLGVTRKIACITYTNVGVDTIMSRLPHDASSFVEVCTIHSFLYRFVVKPFLHFENQSLGIDISKLQIEPPKMFLTKGFAKALLNINNKLCIEPSVFLKNLYRCHWLYENKFTNFRPNNPQKIVVNGNTYSILGKLYDDYVSKRWEQGYISYDDIIYLSIYLINKHPKILTLIRAQFPYFFIDEFQDSPAPIVDFVKKIGNNGIVVGVIGDKAQTIYDFMGASVDLFENFAMPNMNVYEIHGNHRSTQSIINLLNCIRSDFSQFSIGTEIGTKPVLLIGDKLKAYEMATNLCGSNDIYSLAFPNIIANAMKYKESNIKSGKLLNEDFNDTDPKRAMIIRELLKATEYAFHNNYREAGLHLELINNNGKNAIVCLRKLLKQHQMFLDGSLYDFYQFVVNELHIELADFQNNDDEYNFYIENAYKDLALCVDVADGVDFHKTIHKAKGEGYNNVMVILGKKNIDVLLQPNLNENTHRVYYVGMSRARKNLFINIEGVDNGQLEILGGLPLEIVMV